METVEPVSTSNLAEHACPSDVQRRTSQNRFPRICSETCVFMPKTVTSGTVTSHTWYLWCLLRHTFTICPLLPHCMRFSSFAGHLGNWLSALQIHNDNKYSLGVPVELVKILSLQVHLMCPCGWGRVCPVGAVVSVLPSTGMYWYCIYIHFVNSICPARPDLSDLSRFL